MAKKQNDKIEVILGDPQPKKHVTRFDDVTKRPDSPLRSVYIDNQVLDTLGNPEQVRITIEAA